MLVSESVVPTVRHFFVFSTKRKHSYILSERVIDRVTGDCLIKIVKNNECDPPDGAPNRGATGDRRGQ